MGFYPKNCKKQHGERETQVARKSISVDSVASYRNAVISIG